MAAVKEGHGGHRARLRRRFRHCSAVLVAIVAIAATNPNARCAEPGPSIGDYQHTVWTERDGVPPNISVMAQSNDGWLWFGSPNGLYRFDGIRFERVEINGAQRSHTPTISMLYARSSGGLAIGTVHDGVILVKDGRVTLDDNSETRRAGQIQDLVEDADGDLWATAVNGLLHFDGRAWMRVGSDLGYPGGSATGIGLDGAGTLWVASNKAIFSLARGARQFQVAALQTQGYGEFIQLLNGTTSVYSQEDGLRPLPAVKVSVRDPATNWRRSWSEMIDRRGNFWIDQSKDARPYPLPTVNFASIGKRLNTLLEDRQGNIWICGADGEVHRLRRSLISKLPLLDDKRSRVTFASSEAGQVWMAVVSDFAEEAIQGVWLLDHGPHHIQLDDFRSASAIVRAGDGGIWIAGRKGLKRIDDRRFESAVALPGDAQDHSVGAIAPGCAGGLWLSVDGIGLLRHDGTGWKRNGGLAGLPEEPPTVMACGAAGDLWLGYANDRAAHIGNGQPGPLVDSGSPGVGAITAVYSGPTQTVMAGERGLAMRRRDQFVVMRLADPAAAEGATGIVETRDGDLWINNSRGLAHLAASDIDKFALSPNEAIPVEAFGAGDGYPAPGYAVAISGSTIAAAGDGRIWFAGFGGVASLDPIRIDHADHGASPIVIQFVTVAGIEHDPSDLSRLPESTHDVQVGYAALDYSHPERLRFRYRLEGVQDEWVDAGARRQAFYTNLGPGTYRFIVNSTAENGTWSTGVATYDFVIPPTFIESRFFLVLWVSLTLALLGFAYRLRVRAIRSRERQLVESRLRERERIARELHDTLLQGTQGLILAVQAAANQVPTDDPVRAMLQTSLNRANQVMAEGRDRIQELRSAGDAGEDLPRSLALLGKELAQDGRVRFEATVEGEPRDLVSEVAAEIFRIAREALINAFQHAEADSIELQIVYTEDTFVVRVRDDGRGIDATTLEAGARDAHWGLPGMRERAVRIGATLDLWSRAEAGTEIEVKLTAATAYAGL